MNVLRSSAPKVLSNNNESTPRDDKTIGEGGDDMRTGSCREDLHDDAGLYVYGAVSPSRRVYGKNIMFISMVVKTPSLGCGSTNLLEGR